MTAATAAQIAVVVMHSTYCRMSQSNPNSMAANQAAVGQDPFQQDTYISRTKWTPASKMPGFVHMMRQPIFFLTAPTRLYFHAATSGLSGLPTTARTVNLTINGDFESQATNRTMDTTIGSSQASLSRLPINDQLNGYYVTKFVSKPLAGISSISANTWAYNFSAKEVNDSTNYPVNLTNQSVPLACYVWRPSTTSVVGFILDGNSAATVDESAVQNTQIVHHTSFTGSAVASIQDNDVIIFEVLFSVNPGTAGAGPSDFMFFYYDGTTENTTDNATVSNHASFIETPQTLAFTAFTSYSRAPTADDITVSDSSLVRMLSAVRLPSTDSSTVTDSSLTRILSATRLPSTDSVTVADASLEARKGYQGIPSADTTTVTDSSLTRLLSATRAPSDTTGVSDSSLTRILSASRAPSSDSTAVVENSLTRIKTLPREPIADTVTIADSALTRLLSASRAPSTDTITIGENSLSRILSAIRSPSSDSTSVVDADLDAVVIQVISRAPDPETVTVADASLTRIYSALRVPTTETISSSDASLTRLLMAVRSPSSDTVNLSENVDITLSGRVERNLEDNVAVTDSSLTRMLQAFRNPGTDTTNINEQLTRIRILPRAPTSDTVAVSEQSLTRTLYLARSVSADTANVIDASLTRLLQAFRSPTLDNTTVSELNAQISFARSLQETINVTEPLLQRIVTHIRSIEDTAGVGESVFYETYKRLLIESVSVNESLFYEREQLGGSMSYATPAHVRPLLGNLGSQRTDAQIQLAIDSAYDEVNRKTNRIPPNDWKDTEPDFGIVQKITRFKVALEMAVGVKDFQDREWMQKEIDELFMILEQHDAGGELSNDFSVTSEPYTYASSASGLIWSTRYKNLRKNPNAGDEGSITINPDT